MVLQVISYLKRLVFFVIFIVGDGAIMGIDFGSDFVKVASVRPGVPFHIVEDEMSKRKILNLIGFDGNQRIFGNHAKTAAIRKPNRVFKNTIRILGKKLDNPDIKEILDFGYPFKFAELENRRHAVGIQYQDKIFSPEELIAMMFEYIGKIAKDDANSEVKECVLTVPDYFTQQQRIALLDAAEIAGLNVLSLVNENTAAAIQYGIDRKYNASDTPHLVIFYNMGASATTASLVSYSSYSNKIRGKNRTIGQFDVKAKAFDKNLGGQHFTDAIIKILVKEAEKKYTDLVVANEMRVLAKIRDRAEKVKIVLSANKNVSIRIESLYNDRDFSTFITRNQFYTASSDLVARSITPLKNILKEKKLKSEDINSVVIIGGNSRIPAVKDAIKKFMETDELGLNLNGDEAMALGSVFRAANLSVSFQVRQLGMYDITIYPITIRVTDFPSMNILEEEEEEEEEEEFMKETSEQEKSNKSETEIAKENVNGNEKLKENGKGTVETEVPTAGSVPPIPEFEPFLKQATLFKRNSRLDRRKIIKFNHTRDFLCQVFHDVPNSLPEGSSPELVNYNVTGLSALMVNPKYDHLLVFENKTQSPRVSLYFSLDSSGIIRLEKAEAVLYGMVQIPINKPRKRTSLDLKLNETSQNETSQNGTTVDDEKEKDQSSKDDPKEESEQEKKFEDQVTDDQEKDADTLQEENQEKDADSKQAENQEKDKEDEDTKDKGDKDDDFDEQDIQDKQEEDQEKDSKNKETKDKNDTNDTEEEKEEKKKKDQAKTKELEEEVEYKWKKEIYRFPLKLKKLSVMSNIKAVTSKQLQRSRKTLYAFHEADEVRRRISLAKNNLESYIYSTRGKLEDSEIVALVSTEESREQLKVMLMDSEDWLYDQSDDSEDPFVEKLKEMQDLSDPIFLRAHEYTMRPKAIEEVEKVSNYTRSMLADFEISRPWIPEEDRTELLEKMNKLDSWMKNKTAEQENKTLTEEPAFFSTRVLDKLKPIAKLAEEMMRRPKPKEAPKTKSKKEKMNTTAANTTTTVNTTTSDNANNTSEESKAKVETETSGQNEAEKPSDDSDDPSVKDSEDSEHSEHSEDSEENTEKLEESGASGDSTHSEL